MMEKNWREKIWQSIHGPWDILIIGGGITGAGILREATRLGLHCLLVEQCDFAWGTSSRSSKLVHGGFRYLKEGKLTLTRNSVHEREQLLHEGPGLIDPLGFLLTVYKGDFPGRWTYAMGLTVYDLLALHWDHNYYSPQDFQLLAPHISQPEASARVVINATGSWADILRKQAGGLPHIRPLRGSHLIFPNWRLPVAQAVTFLTPFDHRPVFIFPWERVTLVGTTDVDHDGFLANEPMISPNEVAYLMAAVDFQ